MPWEGDRFTPALASGGAAVSRDSTSANVGSPLFVISRRTG